MILAIKIRKFLQELTAIPQTYMYVCLSFDLDHNLQFLLKNTNSQKNNTEEVQKNRHIESN